MHRSLRHGTDYTTRWYPIFIHVWENLLIEVQFQDQRLLESYDVRRNLSYNLQYLEYLQQTVAELSLSAVLKKLTFKSYIICAIGIVESILFHVVKVSGSTKHSLYEILNKVESNSLLGDDRKIYADLQRFRQLRNKVHIYKASDEVGTDYSLFGRDEYEEMRRILHDIFNSTELSMNDDARSQFQFLVVEQDSSES